MATHVVTLVIDRPGPDSDAAYKRLAGLLGEQRVDHPNRETGAFDVAVEADSREEALKLVLDAIAAAGADDEILFLEHPDIPGHWRTTPHRAV